MTNAEISLRLNAAGPRFIDPTVTLGEGCTIWHFAVLLARVRLGDSVSIGAHCEVGRGSIIGDRTRIGKGVFLPSNSLVGDDVFIGPGCTFCDDRWPRAGHSDYHPLPPRIDDGASIGAGSVILPGVRIGRNAIIGAGSIVVDDVPADGHVRGEPARHRLLSSVSREAFAMARSTDKT